MTAQPLKKVGEDTPDPFDPAISLWVSASAGSGKTTLLVRRVLRLLLEMPSPNILCLTYTRAAAAGMQTLIHARLSAWATMEDSALRDDIAGLFGFMAERERLHHARRIFTHILDRPDKLRVMTVHAFCQYILQSFPLEAGLLPHFTLLEGEAIDHFQTEVLDAFLEKARLDSGLLDDLGRLSTGRSSLRLRGLLEEIFYGRAAWEAFWDQGREGPNVAEGETGHVLARLLKETPRRQLREACGLLAQATKTAQARGRMIEKWLALDEASDTAFEDYAKAFLTREGEIQKKLVPAAMQKGQPDAARCLENEAARVHQTNNQLAGLRFAACQAAFRHVMRAMDRISAELKARQAVLTYDDLVLRTRALLADRAQAPWILYKLDRAIDHLLIDEAQDTSPDQWRIVMSLLEEFLSGEGARAGTSRNLFVVGDEKQSIYSFQGADRDAYLQVRDTLFARMAAIKRPLHDMPRHQSFRTAPAILDYVDAVFAVDTARRGVSRDPVRHASARGAAAGLVELWPPVQEAAMPPPVPWEPPITREDHAPAEVVLAQRIARTIRAWLDGGMRLASEDRAVAPDDVMILLQKRSRLLSPIVRALKDCGVPVAGADRMVLSEQAAVQDVLSLCRFLLLPQDDLALAEVLRGPFVRLDDAALFALAHARSTSLWEALQGRDEAAAAVAYFRELLAQTDYVTPFALLARILFGPCPAEGGLSGQQALALRLGADAVDPLEELLALALEFQQRRTASLQLFVQALARDARESKRELSKIKGQVRILTVHGAKGLEAPIVFVPDLARDPHRNAHAPQLYWGADGSPLAVATDDVPHAPLNAAKERARAAREEEHRRLLYVALTRARDVMILCGIAREGAAAAPWHDLCSSAMDRLGATPFTHPDGGEAWRYGDEKALMLPLQRQEHAAAAPSILPEWLLKPAGREETPAVVNPSQIGLQAERVLAPDVRAHSYQRGTLLHTLLQLLPDVAQESREETALQWLARQMPEQDESARHDDVREIMKVIADPVFTRIFSAGSQAEVPLAGRIGGRAFSGQVDRLVVDGSSVLVVDYKTNRPPPENMDGVPEDYLAQMAAYRSLLASLYPGKSIRCALLWTHRPLLMELDAAALAKGATILKRRLEQL